MVMKRMMHEKKKKQTWNERKTILKSKMLSLFFDDDDDEIQFIKLDMEILCTIGKDKMQQCIRKIGIWENIQRHTPL